MTRDEFRSMKRGDIVVANGNGPCVVEGVFFENGTITVDLELQRGDIAAVRGIPETAAEVIRRLPRREPAPDAAPAIAHTARIDRKNRKG